MMLMCITQVLLFRVGVDLWQISADGYTSRACTRFAVGERWRFAVSLVGEKHIP
jgi:hypothetical protein